MGIYLGQLPPAEIARLKAELAETIIANFCYPRFFDYQTNSLRMRPVDRAKRQEVWLFLSSVDFTTWNRVDMMSLDLQRCIERLFIQFVQRNRNFFGQQGRKRMPDVRTLITASSTTVVQGLRTHITGSRQEKQALPAFGSPKQTISWSVMSGGRTEVNWEQVSAKTLFLQQQLQEIRGETKVPPTPVESRPVELRSSRPVESPAKRNGNGRPAVSTQPSEQGEQGERRVKQAVNGAATLEPHQGSKDAKSSTPTYPLQPAPVSASITTSLPQPAPALPVETAPTVIPTPASISTARAAASISPAAEPSSITNTPTQPVAPVQVRVQPGQVTPTTPATPPPSPITVVETSVEVAGGNQTTTFVLGEDDMVIFEQLRHQMTLWLRIEALHAGVETAGQGPAQLLDLLRQQERSDETRLQVVSTLLNLANQVIKNRRVSVLDYKQALMFHLMHTRR
jgi:hypothetical protein